jgi:hypothetical protein
VALELILFSQYISVILNIFKTIQKLNSSWHSLRPLWDLLWGFIVWIHLFVLIIFFNFFQLYYTLFLGFQCECFIFVKPVGKSIIQMHLFLFKDAYFWSPVHFTILLLMDW